MNALWCFLRGHHFTWLGFANSDQRVAYRCDNCNRVYTRRVRP